MSAFPESGRSDRQKLGEIRVRFRPEAAIPLLAAVQSDANEQHRLITVINVMVAG
jgi:hypothetical protein